MNFETARTQMLGQQLRAWDVLDERVLDTIAATPRERFVPRAYCELAFADIEIPIGHGQNMLAPKVEGRLLQALQVTPIDDVLEVGTGTGYMTACLARLAAQVRSIDIYPDFVAGASAMLDELGATNVQCETLDALTLEVPSTYDAVAVTGSMPTLDERFVRMLKPRGRLFLVVGRSPIMEAKLITMHPGGEWTEESLFETLLTPLENVDQPEPFVLQADAVVMPDIPELTPAEFMGRWRPGADDVVLLDVREDQELARASIEGALHIPMNEIPARLAELDRGKPIVAMCHSGARSLRVATFLNAQGFGQVFNLKGGIEAWLRDVETQSPRD